jgi:histidyl-tRNA synthetase
VVHGALGAQNSVLGGGRYDGLAESLGSKVHSPGIGFSIGEDRLVMSVEGEQQSTPLDLFVAPLGTAATRHAGTLARDFRRAGHSVELVEAKLKRAMELANKSGARFAVIIGDDEINAGRYAFKNMASGEQQNLTRDEILNALSAAKK